MVCRTLSFALVSMNAQPHRRASCSPSALDTWRWLSRSHLLPTSTLIVPKNTTAKASISIHRRVVIDFFSRDAINAHWHAVNVLSAKDLVLERRDVVEGAAARHAVHEQETLAFAHPLYVQPSKTEVSTSRSPTCRNTTGPTRRTWSCIDVYSSCPAVSRMSSSAE